MHLFPLRYPSREAADGEHDRVHICGNTDYSVKNSAVKINIGIELPFDKKIVIQGGPLKLHGDFHKRLMYTVFFYQIIAMGFQDSCPRIITLVNAVAETEQPEGAVFIFCLINALPYGYAVMLNAFQHFDDFLVRSAVQGAPQSADTGADR